MAEADTVLRIKGQDDTGGAFAAIKAHLAALDKQVATFDRLMASARKVAGANDPMIASIAASSKALTDERAALAALGETMAGATATTEGAAGAQAALAAEVARTTEVMVVQGSEATRVSHQIAAAQHRQAAAAREASKGFKHAFTEALPFAGPALLVGTKKAIEAGGTLEEEIAKLAGAGATAAQIAQARSEFGELSKTNSGMLEADFLAVFKDALTIAPKEPFEMARLGATYRLAARNTGLALTEHDASNVMRIMDELGLNSTSARVNFLDNFLKSQQQFGAQVPTETALSAYQHAKQSIYDWSPEFRDKYFPTLLQSSGEQGGTAMMTALYNYVGGHMMTSEFEKLIAAGFVRQQDIYYKHNKPVLRPGAHLFEADLFKSNIVKWAWDFRDAFLKRPGATEGKFEDLIDAMPRNMAGLIAFAVHNRQRIERDVDRHDLPPGLSAATDTYLTQNPVAAMGAFETAISQFSAVVSSPAVAAAGPVLADLAHGVQLVSAAAGDFAKKHPAAMTAASLGGGAAAGGAGAWLTWKLFTGLGRLFGFGGRVSMGEAAGAAGVAAAESGAGALLSRGAVAVLGAASLPGLIDFVTGDNRSPQAKANDAAALNWIRRQFHAAFGGAPGAPMALPGAVAPTAVGGSGGLPLDKIWSRANVAVSGEVHGTIPVHVEVTASPLLQAVISAAEEFRFTAPLNPDLVGRMDTDAAPVRRPGGIGHM